MEALISQRKKRRREEKKMLHRPFESTDLKAVKKGMPLAGEESTIPMEFGRRWAAPFTRRLKRVCNSLRDRERNLVMATEGAGDV